MLNTPDQRIRYIAEQETNGELQELAHKLGMAYDSLYPYSTGKRKPGHVILERFGQLGYSASWILMGQGTIHITGSELQETLKPEVNKISEDKNVERFEVIVPHGFKLAKDMLKLISVLPKT